MLVASLSFYLIFIIVASLAIGFLVLKLKLSHARIMIPSLIFLIIFPGIAGYLFIAYFTSIPNVIVPDLRGMTLSATEVKLASLKLKWNNAGNVFDTKYPEGVVAVQRPEAGREVKEGRIINLLISSGKGKAMVPNLLGRTLEQTQVMLAAEGLALGERQEDYVKELDPGIILSQDPLPGEEVEAGALVNITISASQETKREGDTEEPKGGFKLWPW